MFNIDFDATAISPRRAQAAREALLAAPVLRGSDRIKDLSSERVNDALVAAAKEYHVPFVALVPYIFGSRRPKRYISLALVTPDPEKADRGWPLWGRKYVC